MIVGVVPVGSVKDIGKAIEALETPLVDVVELRLDYMQRIDDMLEAIREASELGVLNRAVVTVRAWWEGGRVKIGDEERLGVLKAALDHGAMLVDLEVLTLERVEPDTLEALDWSRVLLSLHVPAEEFNEGLGEYLLAKVRGLGAWGAKLALRAGERRRVEDKLYWFLGESRRLNIRAAVMPYGCCMGLRLALYAAGSALLYACAKRGIGGTAEGQPCLEEDTHRSLVECAHRIRAVNGGATLRLEH